MRLAAHYSLTHKVDVAERSHDVQVADDVGVDVVHEAVAESLHKFGSCAVGVNGKVDEFVLWRHISVDYRSSVVLVERFGVDVDASLLVVVSHVGIECAHASRLELELLDGKVGAHLRFLAEHASHDCVARRHSEEVDRMEVDEIQDVAHVDVLQRYGKRVLQVVRGCAVNDKMLVAVLDGEVVYVKMILIVSDACRHDVPCGVAYGGFRLQHVHVSRGKSLLVLGEEGAGVDDAVHGMAAVGAECGGGLQTVAESVSRKTERQSLALVRQLLEADVGT